MAQHAVLPLGSTSSTVQNIDATAAFPVYTTGWITSTTATSTGNSDTITGTDYFSSALVELNVTAATGTSETLNVYVQQLLPDGTNWQDIASFTAVTTSTGKWTVELTNGGNAAQAVSLHTLTAATVVQVPFTGFWRIYYVIGGTDPSYTFTVSATFKK